MMDVNQNNSNSKNSHTDLPIKLPADAPIELAADVPVELAADVPVELAADAPVELGTDAPVELDTDAPVELDTDAPVELGTGSKNILKDLIMRMLPEGGYLNSCLNCGICASGCPASGIEGMDPRKFIRMLSLGVDEEIMNNEVMANGVMTNGLMTNNWVWICTASAGFYCPKQLAGGSKTKKNG